MYLNNLNGLKYLDIHGVNDNLYYFIAWKQYIRICLL